MTLEARSLKGYLHNTHQSSNCAKTINYFEYLQKPPAVQKGGVSPSLPFLRLMNPFSRPPQVR